MQRLLRGVVRPVRGTDQTGRRAERQRSDEHSLGRDPVGASVRRIALGVLKRQGDERRTACRGWKSRITRKKSKGNEIVDLFCILIDWMPQLAVTLYIYMVGGLVPQEILLQDLNL